jgi:hypothetical protein
VLTDLGQGVLLLWRERHISESECDVPESVSTTTGENPSCGAVGNLVQRFLDLFELIVGEIARMDTCHFSPKINEL